MRPELLPRAVVQALNQTEPFWVCLNRPEEFCEMHDDEDAYMVDFEVRPRARARNVRKA